MVEASMLIGIDPPAETPSAPKADPQGTGTPACSRRSKVGRIGAPLLTHSICVCRMAGPSVLSSRAMVSVYTTDLPLGSFRQTSPKRSSINFLNIASVSDWETCALGFASMLKYCVLTQLGSPTMRSGGLTS